MFAQSVVAGPLSGNAKTKRIPAGTPFQLQLTNSVTSLNSEGTEFTAIMMGDQTADADVILPMGSLVRGTIKKVTPAKRFSKGAIVYLDFDHVVTPNGRQLPLSMSVVGRTDITYDLKVIKKHSVKTGKKLKKLPQMQPNGVKMYLMTYQLQIKL